MTVTDCCRVPGIYLRPVLVKTTWSGISGLHYKYLMSGVVSPFCHVFSLTLSRIWTLLPSKVRPYLFIESFPEEVWWVQWHHLSGTYNTVLASLLRQFQHHSHLEFCDLGLRQNHLPSNAPSNRIET